MARINWQLTAAAMLPIAGVVVLSQWMGERIRNYRKAAALATGFKEARGELIVTMDADLQDDPAEIPNLIAKLDAGADLVLTYWALEVAEIDWRRPERYAAYRQGHGEVKSVQAYHKDIR